MGISALSIHLRHPLTYKDVKGKIQHLSSKEMTCVTIIVLSSLALGTAEAIKSNRSLKSSLVTIGIVAGALFYLATAIMKMASRGEGSSARKDLKLPEQKKPQDKSVPTAEGEKKTQGDSRQVSKPAVPKTLLVSAMESPVKSEQIVEEAPSENLLLVSVMGLPEKEEFVDLSHASVPKMLYQQLVVTREEAVVIMQMISMIGNESVFTLYWYKDELLKFGNCIKDVHPLKFLETTLNDPMIKNPMRKIKSSSLLKWPGFLDGNHSSPGFIARCQLADNLGAFEPYIDDFCQAVKVDAQKVRVFYEAKEWKELIEFLIDS
jgi:hypothetical protein